MRDVLQQQALLTQTGAAGASGVTPWRAASALAEIPCTHWHEFAVEDSMHVHARRPHEDADWRHVEASRREPRS